MMRLWGRKSSINVQKVIWCLTELQRQEQRDYERIDAGLHFGINTSPEFLKLNPNGLVPTLQDGQLTLWESNSILRYLARTYDAAGTFFPSDNLSQANSDKWLDWQLSILWPALRLPFLGLTRVPEAERNYAGISKGFTDTHHYLGHLNTTLQNQAYCSGERFNLGDIALALCVNRWILLADTFPEHLSARPQYEYLENWFKRIQTQTQFATIAETELMVSKPQI
ncbi:MAG: glutathione S-transferase N-terminal domain-containing protein [Burkholderiales bacterium]|nr:glutathione S-transferase N-terminal domain-containing protein [Polynucleobacter sp.]MCX7244235.1 glutathione S-transferase N-terminal domain-containing protein [Burkholderiales bacterium]